MQNFPTQAWQGGAAPLQPLPNCKVLNEILHLGCFGVSLGPYS